MYNYSVILDEHPIETTFTYSIDDISKENINLINSVYKKDFDNFGYEIINIDDTKLTEDITEDKVKITEKQLKYIHITRTGGTSIEQIGLDSKLFWGRYDISYGTFDEPFILKSPALKNNYEWFTVVRNPYTRILSEYNYLKIVLRIKIADDPTVFNTYLEKWLNIIKNSGKVHGHHLIQQNKYIDLKYNINVLKYENIQEDFCNLMSKYKHSLILNKHVSVSNGVLSVYNITPANILLIQTVYKQDFEQCGYSEDYFK